MDTRQFVNDAVERAVERAARSSFRDAQKDASRAAQLHQRLSRVVGAFDPAEMDHAAMARHGLAKLNRDVPDDDAAAIVAIEAYLDGLSAGKTGGGGMDAAPDSFVSRYLNAP